MRVGPGRDAGLRGGYPHPLPIIFPEGYHPPTPMGGEVGGTSPRPVREKFRATHLWEAPQPQDIRRKISRGMCRAAGNIGALLMAG